jgi:hypothetical protein
MKRRCAVFFALVFSVASRQALAAIREPRPAEKAIRVLADAKAEQPLAAARELQAAPASTSAPAPEVVHDESLRRELLEHSNHLNARFDQLDAKIYEIVGRLQLLAGCLIALFLGMAVWQIWIARQIAQLKGARQIGESGGLG